VRARLAQATGLPTFVDNDAKALCLGEGWKGAAAASDNFIAMVVSTGVGGGIVLDGRSSTVPTATPATSPLIVEPEGRPCRVRRPRLFGGRSLGPCHRRRHRPPAAEADAATVGRTGMLVGRAVASVANLLDLRLAVVGGSVALGFGQPFFAPLRPSSTPAPASTSRRGSHRPGRAGRARPPRRGGGRRWRGLRAAE